MEFVKDLCQRSKVLSKRISIMYQRIKLTQEKFQKPIFFTTDFSLGPPQATVLVGLGCNNKLP